MARRRKNRTPPTPAQRRRMMIIGALLVAFACFTVLYEVIVYEGQRPIAFIIASLLLFLVFILPIILSVRSARRKRALHGGSSG